MNSSKLNIIEDDLDFSRKTVLIRCDLNLPLDANSNKYNQTRLLKNLETINHIIEKSKNTAKIILASHYGRPEKNLSAEAKKKYSIAQVADLICHHLQKDLIIVDDYLKNPPARLFMKFSHKQILILENLRFYPQEIDNDLDFSKNLTKGIDFFINDAFSVCHRKHASITGIPTVFDKKKCYAGKLLQKEYQWLSKLNANPCQPFLLIVGGSKVKTKIAALLNLINTTNSVFITGAMALAFLKTKGINVGDHLISQYELDLANIITRTCKQKATNLYLTLDHKISQCADPFSVNDSQKIKTTDTSAIPYGYFAYDIGNKSINLLSDLISKHKTVLWNGPAGVIENELFRSGSEQIAQLLAESKDKFGNDTIVGGGDTLSITNQAKFNDKFSYQSCAGGAMLEYFARDTLPGLSFLFNET